MAMTDPLGDMLTRIRNGQQARKDSIVTPASNLRVRVLDVLQREGYIRGYSEEELAGHRGLRIELKYFEGQPAIQHLARVSKPGRRVYSAARELPRVRNGLGTIIVSTPRGVLSDAEAREQNVGGEVLAEVFSDVPHRKTASAAAFGRKRKHRRPDSVGQGAEGNASAADA